MISRRNFCLGSAALIGMSATGRSHAQNVDSLYEAAKAEGTVVAYDTPLNWANFEHVIKTFEAKYPGVTVVYGDLGSGPTVAKLEAEKNSPKGDTAYYGFPFGALAQGKGLTEGFKPSNFDRIPAAHKDPDGHWFGIHQLNLALMVNTKVVKNIPTTWADLLKPEYAGMVSYYDPRTTQVGIATVLAAAIANGGSETDIGPGVDFLEKLDKSGNIQRYVTAAAYASFLKGELPILVEYDLNGYRAKNTPGISAEVVLPADGTISVPYVQSFVKGAPHPNAGKLWLEFLVSDEGQIAFAEGFVGPILPDITLPASVQEKLLPPEAYAAVKTVDWAKVDMDDLKSQWGSRILG